ncbi:MAG: hypothetical protein AAF292_11115 [Pseudomonadota bacterium]
MNFRNVISRLIHMEDHVCEIKQARDVVLNSVNEIRDEIAQLVDHIDRSVGSMDQFSSQKIRQLTDMQERLEIMANEQEHSSGELFKKLASITPKPEDFD